MPMIRKPTGLKGRDPGEIVADEKWFSAPPMSLPAEYLQTLSWLQDQPRFGSCGGKTGSNGCHGILGPPWVSATGLWLDAQRRRFGTVDPNDGCYLGDVARSMVQRGFDPLHPGEDYSIADAGWKQDPKTGLWQDSVRDEMAADDRRVSITAANRVIVPSTEEDTASQVQQALALNWCVMYGTGLRDGYFQYQPRNANETRVLTEVEIGGNNNGHARRLAGWKTQPNGRIAFLEVNSWGPTWGGAIVPSHYMQTYSDGCIMQAPGCIVGHAWVDQAVLADAWAIHAVELKIA
jgi:hypothetical protein